MRILQGMDTALSPRSRIAALGMFDGVHRGHQRLLKEAVSWARRAGAEAAVITFDRHPRALLGSAPLCITSLEHRLLLFEDLGPDLCLVLPFDQRTASMRPEDFVAEVLCDYLHVRGVVLGLDQRFGRGGRGDAVLMRRLGDEFGFETCNIEAVLHRGHPISSTALRSAISEGRLDEAGEMMGRPVSILGTVMRSSGRGRLMGFPTANISPHHEVLPPDGVYLSQTMFADKWWPSLTHIGARPAFRDVDAAFAATRAVESYVHGFSGDLYGRQLEVRIIRLIRAVMSFATEEDLRRQLLLDLRELERAIADGRL